MTTVTIYDPEVLNPTEQPRASFNLAEDYRKAFLFTYPHGLTRQAYDLDTRQWFQACRDANLDPIYGIKRLHVEMWVRSLEERYAIKTVARRLCTVKQFYDYLVSEEVIPASPAGRVKKIKTPPGFTTKTVSRPHLGRLVATAEKIGPMEHALMAMLVHNGLRASEVCSANVETFTMMRGHWIIAVHRKGGKDERIPLNPPTVNAIQSCLNGRTTGPLITSRTGRRLNRRDVYAWVKRIAEEARIDGIHPHAIWVGAITAILDAGATMRDAQQFAGHASINTTSGYDRNRDSKERHPTYVMGGWLADVTELVE